MRHGDVPATPYAVLLVKPVDSDDTVRYAFHEIAKREHPDRPGGGGTAGSGWQAAKEAYEAVRSEAKREAWRKTSSKLARLCANCQGYGVTWRRMSRDKAVKVCAACGGLGRKPGGL